MFYLSGSQIGKRKRGAKRFTRAQKGKRVVRLTGNQRGRLRVGGYYGRYANGGELKFHDVAVDQGIIQNTGNIMNSGTINVIAQDTTESTRVGRKVVVKSVMWRYELSLPEQDAVATPASNDNVRCILYLDKQCNGATAAVGNILQSADFQSFNNLANSNRFVILYDKTHTLNYQSMASDNAGVVSQARHSVRGSFYKKCNIPLEYDSSAQTGAIGTIRSNNLGVLLISQSTQAGMDSQIRLRFSDA